MSVLNHDEEKSKRYHDLSLAFYKSDCSSSGYNQKLLGTDPCDKFSTQWLTFTSIKYLFWTYYGYTLSLLFHKDVLYCLVHKTQRPNIFSCKLKCINILNCLTIYISQISRKHRYIRFFNDLNHFNWLFLSFPNNFI